MKIGCTVGYKDTEKIALCAKAGFDYVEVALNSFAVCTDEECESFKKALKENNIPCEAANCLFPGSIKLCAETLDEKAVEEYLEKAFARAKDVGVDTVVFGSGGSRFIQEGVTREKALCQLETVCVKYLDPIGRKYGITVVIEPLNKKETNIFNSVEESMVFVNKLGLANVKCLADSYHMDVESEPYTNVKLAGKDLRDTHIANPDGRVMPAASDANDYSPFFASLKEFGYEGRVSVEAGVPEGKTLAEALSDSAEFLRKCI